MDYRNPRYKNKKGGSGGTLPIIHEEVSQIIQGGVAGEHYHLTKTEWDRRLYYLEPMTSVVGPEIVFSKAGDVMVGKVYYAP